MHVRLVASVQLKARFESTMKALDIRLGQAAGFTLDELAAMFGSQAGVTIDRGLLLQRAKEIDATVRKLQLLSRGLKHAARCTQPEHRHCEEFKRVVAKGLRLVG